MKKNNEKKPVSDERMPSAAHIEQIRAAGLAKLEAEAAVGRAFLASVAAAQQSSAANQAYADAHARALLSLGIDPTGASGHWDWDPTRAVYVKKE